MPKNLVYHDSAILYNEELADHAEELAERVEDPDVKKWCKSVAKQHRFHLGRHKRAKEALERGSDSKETEVTEEQTPESEKTEAQKQAEFAAEQEQNDVGTEMPIPPTGSAPDAEPVDANQNTGENPDAAPVDASVGPHNIVEDPNA